MRAPNIQGWLIDAVEVLVVAFVLDDVAVTFQLDSFNKGLVGSASFFGKPLRGGQRPKPFTRTCIPRAADASLVELAADAFEINSTRYTVPGIKNSYERYR